MDGNLGWQKTCPVAIHKMTRSILLVATLACRTFVFVYVFICIFINVTFVLGKVICVFGKVFLLSYLIVELYV